MRYKLYSNQGLKLMNMFANLNEPLHYLKKQHLFAIFNEGLSKSIKVKNNIYMICDEEVKAISIINRNIKKCYIYIKDLFEFDINSYLEEVLDQNVDFNWVIADETIYRRLLNLVDNNDILVTDTLKYLDTSVDNLVSRARDYRNERLNYTSSLKEVDIDNLTNGQFYKIIDNNHIYVYNRSKVIFINVSDAKDFLNRYFVIQPENSDPSYHASNEYGDFSFDGYKANFKGHIILNDMIKDIIGLISVDYLTEYYRINNIYMRNIDNNILNKMIISLFETVSISKDEVVYLEEIQETNLHKYLGFNNSFELTTTYLYNGDVQDLYSYPELKVNLKKEYNFKALIIQNIIILLMVLFASFVFISYTNKNNIIKGTLLTTYILFMTFYITVYFRPHRFKYKEQIIKSYYFIKTSLKSNLVILALNLLVIIILLVMKN